MFSESSIANTFNHILVFIGNGTFTAWGAWHDSAANTLRLHPAPYRATLDQLPGFLDEARPLRLLKKYLKDGRTMYVIAPSYEEPRRVVERVCDAMDRLAGKLRYDLYTRSGVMAEICLN